MNAEQLDAYDNLGRQQAARIVGDAAHRIALAVRALETVNPDYIDWDSPQVDQLMQALTDLAGHPLAGAIITTYEEA